MTPPRPVYRRHDGDLTAVFCSEWDRLGGSSVIVAAPDVRSTIESIVGDRTTVEVADGPAPAASEEGGSAWPPCGLLTVEQADVGVVPATGAIAATGTVVVDSTRLAGRAPALLPPAAIFVIRAATIVSTPTDLLLRTRAWWPDGLPSQFVLVTGPSRSADIEMSLTIGVHAPGEVHAIIVPGA